ncbi:MAG: Coenzyme F420 hydrogenase/dehydrogenase, beta subunit C-terminal domain [Candidatus Bathyarchaeia archaeon]
MDQLTNASGVKESVEKIWFRKLASAVIDADRCIQCASCIAACPSHSLSIAEDDRPTLVRMCTGCSFCWDFCPRGGLRNERLWKLEGGEEAVEGIGPVLNAHTARALQPATNVQDGGVVTTILRALLEKGEIQGALIAKRSETSPLRGEPYIARTVEDINRNAGSFYNQTLALVALMDTSNWTLPPDASIAVVGTPCEISGIKALQRFPWPLRKTHHSAVKYTVSLMCTRSFNLGRLLQRLKTQGVDLSSATRIDVKKNILTVYNADGSSIYAGNVRRFRDAALRGCDECADFSGKLADISVGSVGSPKGYSTVLVRTIQGLKAWKTAESNLERRDVDDLNAVIRVEEKNKHEALHAMKRKFHPDSPVWVPYEEHTLGYRDTDRAPVKPATYRIHHYEITC